MLGWLRRKMTRNALVSAAAHAINSDRDEWERLRKMMWPWERRAAFYRAANLSKGKAADVLFGEAKSN